MAINDDNTTSMTSGDALVTVRRATDADLRDVLAVQRAAFGRVSERLRIPQHELPPLRESLDILGDLLRAGWTFLVATSVEQVIGTVRAERREDGVVEIGRLAVADGWVRRGVATRLMNAIEVAYPDADRFELFTGADAVEPLALYAKLGYREFRREDIGHIMLVWLAKDR